MLRAAFASDVGVDDPPLATKDRGYVWFEVAKVEPARHARFDEVKDQVAAQWRDDQVAKALSAKAADMVQKINAGATLASLAEPGQARSENRDGRASARRRRSERGGRRRAVQHLVVRRGFGRDA